MLCCNNSTFLNWYCWLNFYNRFKPTSRSFYTKKAISENVNRRQIVCYVSNQVSLTVLSLPKKKNCNSYSISNIKIFYFHTCWLHSWIALYKILWKIHWKIILNETLAYFTIDFSRFIIESKKVKILFLYLQWIE